MPLNFDELIKISAMTRYRDGDAEPLIELLRSERTLNADLRNFIADILAGKIKKKRGRKKDFGKPGSAALYRMDNDASNNALDNFIGFCHSHHSIKTYLFENKERYLQLAMPFFLPKPRLPVTVVCGRPGSGKSTYVTEHATSSDLVLDLDGIIAEMTGLPIYQSSKDTDYLKALKLRNERLAALSTPNDYARCWLIVSGKTIQERIFWRFKLHADVVIMRTPLDECLRRIEHDTRRPNEAKRNQMEAARRWR